MTLLLGRYLTLITVNQKATQLEREGEQLEIARDNKQQNKRDRRDSSQSNRGKAPRVD